MNPMAKMHNKLVEHNHVDSGKMSRCPKSPLQARISKDLLPAIPTSAKPQRTEICMVQKGRNAVLKTTSPLTAKAVTNEADKRVEPSQKSKETVVQKATAGYKNGSSEKKLQGSKVSSEERNHVIEAHRLSLNAQEMTAGVNIAQKDTGTKARKKKVVLCSDCTAASNKKAVCFIANDGKVVACTTRPSEYVRCKYQWCATNDPDYMLSSAPETKKFLVSKRHLLKPQIAPKSKDQKTPSPSSHEKGKLNNTISCHKEDFTSREQDSVYGAEEMQEQSYGEDGSQFTSRFGSGSDEKGKLSSPSSNYKEGSFYEIEAMEEEQIYINDGTQCGSTFGSGSNEKEESSNLFSSETIVLTLDEDSSYRIETAEEDQSDSHNESHYTLNFCSISDGMETLSNPISINKQVLCRKESSFYGTDAAEEEQSYRDVVSQCTSTSGCSSVGKESNPFSSNKQFLCPKESPFYGTDAAEEEQSYRDDVSQCTSTSGSSSAEKEKLRSQFSDHDEASMHKEEDSLYETYAVDKEQSYSDEIQYTCASNGNVKLNNQFSSYKEVSSHKEMGPLYGADALEEEPSDADESLYPYKINCGSDKKGKVNNLFFNNEKASGSYGEEEEQKHSVEIHGSDASDGKGKSSNHLSTYKEVSSHKEEGSSYETDAAQEEPRCSNDGQQHTSKLDCGSDEMVKLNNEKGESSTIFCSNEGMSRPEEEASFYGIDAAEEVQNDNDDSQYASKFGCASDEKGNLSNLFSNDKEVSSLEEGKFYGTNTAEEEQRYSDDAIRHTTKFGCGYDGINPFSNHEDVSTDKEGSLYKTDVAEEEKSCIDDGTEHACKFGSGLESSDSKCNNQISFELDDHPMELGCEQVNDGMSGRPSRRSRGHLDVVQEQESETVKLRRQLMQERRHAEEWMIDNTIQKLAPNGEHKVKILVEAFESIIAHNDGQTHELHWDGGTEHIPHNHIAMHC